MVRVRFTDVVPKEDIEELIKLDAETEANLESLRSTYGWPRHTKMCSDSRREERHDAIEAEVTRLSTGRAIALEEILAFVGTVFVGIILVIFFFTTARDHLYILIGICVLFIGLLAMSVKGILGIRRRRRAYTDYLETSNYSWYLWYRSSPDRFTDEYEFITATGESVF